MIQGNSFEGVLPQQCNVELITKIYKDEQERAKLYWKELGDGRQYAILGYF